MLLYAENHSILSLDHGRKTTIGIVICDKSVFHRVLAKSVAFIVVSIGQLPVIAESKQSKIAETDRVFHLLYFGDIRHAFFKRLFLM